MKNFKIGLYKITNPPDEYLEDRIKREALPAKETHQINDNSWLYTNYSENNSMPCFHFASLDKNGLECIDENNEIKDVPLPDGTHPIRQNLFCGIYKNYVFCTNEYNMSVNWLSNYLNMKFNIDTKIEKFFDKDILDKIKGVRYVKLNGVQDLNPAEPKLNKLLRSITNTVDDDFFSRHTTNIALNLLPRRFRNNIKAQRVVLERQSSIDAAVREYVLDDDAESYTICTENGPIQNDKLFIRIFYKIDTMATNEKKNLLYARFVDFKDELIRKDVIRRN